MDYSFKLTTHGRAALASCTANEAPPRLTRVAFGSGRISEGVDLADVHQLVKYVADGTIGQRTHKDDRLSFAVQYENISHREISSVFYLSEFMVYIQDPETGKDTDLLYATLGDYIQTIPPYRSNYPVAVWTLPLTIILSSELEVSIDAPAGLVTWGDLNMLIDGLAVRRMDLTIPAAGWVRDGTGRYPFRRDVPAATATEVMIPSLTVLQAGEDAAIACGLCPRAQTLDGAVRVFAASAPAVNIPVSLTLQGDASGYLPSSEGGVRAGAGLKMSQDGTISVDAATDTEFSAMLNEVFGA